MYPISQRQLSPFLKKKQTRSDFSPSDKGESHNKVSVRGITLRQYFRLCDQTITYEHMESIQQQSQSSNKDEQKQTPSFGFKNNKENMRQRFKTDHIDDSLHYLQGNHKKNVQNEYKSFNKINISMQDANVLENTKKDKKSNHKSKRIVILNGKNANETLNKTSSGSFYYINAKKDKMLEKVRVQRERINSIKLNQLMLVTKYANKFGLNSKDIIK